MKEYKLVPQETQNFGLCSVLQAILEKNGMQVSQSEIGFRLTRAKYGFLVDDNKVKTFLEEKGFKYDFFWHDKLPYEVDMVLEDMQKHEGVIGIDKQVYLVTAFHDPDVEMLDPGNNTKIRKSMYDIMGEMVSKEGFFAVIERKG